MRNNNIIKPVKALNDFDRFMRIIKYLPMKRHWSELKIFAILDTAKDKYLYKKLRSMKVIDNCLFKQAEEKHLESVAPYLVQCQNNDSFLQWVIENGFGKSLGIFLISDADVQTLISHLQKLIHVVVEGEPDKKYFFRYYDPRVLGLYLPSCTPYEKNLFLGPIEHIILEDLKKLQWLTFGRYNYNQPCFGI